MCVVIDISHFSLGGNINISNIRNLKHFMCFRINLSQLLFKIKENIKTVPWRGTKV